MADFKNNKNALEDFVKLIKDTYSISIESIGVTSYVFNNVDSVFKMTTSSVESERLNEFNHNHVKENGSILSPLDFIEESQVLESYNDIIISENKDEINYYLSQSFDFNLRDRYSIKNLQEHILERKKDELLVDSQKRFERWSSEIFSNGLGTYALKYTSHLLTPDVQNRIGVSVFIISAGIVNLENQKEIFYDEIKKFLTAPSNLLYFLSNAFDAFVNEIRNNEQNLKIQARKSALSAIMSRNMSHNIGSHVLPGIQQILSAENGRRTELVKLLDLDKNCLSDRDWKNKCTEPELLKTEFVEKEMEIDNSVASINKHIQERMEFIADVSMAETFMHTSLSIKSVLEDFKKKKEFLKNLTGGAFVDIVLKISIENNVCNDLYADFPNDIMGVHALYIIMENVIRNTVKHSNLEQSHFGFTMLNIHVAISEDENSVDYYNVDLYDDLGVSNQNDRSRNDKELLKGISAQLNADVINPKTNQIRTGGWGLLEIKFAADYLVGKLKGDENHIALDQIVSVNFYDIEGNISDTSLNLGYRFLLRKPRFAKCYLPIDSRLDKERELILSRWGIAIEYFTNSKVLMKATEHQFLICPIRNRNLYINQRVIWNFSLDNLLQYLKNENKSRVMRFIWKSWIDQSSLSYYEIFKEASHFPKKNQTKIAFFDNHGLCLRNQKKEVDLAYYEPYGSQSSTAKYITGDLSEKSTLFWEWQEVIDTKIAIVDERIQQAMQEVDSNVPRFRKNEILEKMGIEILKLKDSKDSLSIDLENFIHHPDYNKIQLESYIISLLKDHKISFLIIHLTIFELLCDTKDCDGISKKLEFFKSKIRGANEKSIILTSGRGTPSNLPLNCYFLHFSILQNYLIYNRSKFSLVKALYSVRKLN